MGMDVDSGSSGTQLCEPGDVIIVRRTKDKDTLHLHYALYVGSFDGREVVINLESGKRDCCCYCADCEELSDGGKYVCRVKELYVVLRSNDSAKLSSTISSKSTTVPICSLKTYLLNCALKKDCTVSEPNKAESPCKQFVLDFLDECGLTLNPTEPLEKDSKTVEREPVVLDDEEGALAGAGFSTQVERVFRLLYLMFPVVTVLGGMVFRVLKLVAKAKR
ncbi:hypothetical protein RvY_12796 [Ramazzottius varieornatus]|uniref:LRAT domain-containing protein n=1 Tax=Ramazzottius varieornatus TaxID=947166 RepID=A0A1D1VMR0_RAMVA|nr:hypothetical protein RvY_12796 [Ramazzottius varieornatus]